MSVEVPSMSQAAGSEAGDDAVHVLVVEDDVHIRQLMTVLLSRAGYMVATARRCDEAEQLLKAQTFSVAVLDVCLPDGRGDQIALRLRQESPETRIVMTSAFSQLSPLLQSAAALGDVFLAKPFKNADLLSAVTTPQMKGALQTCSQC
jgi:DNA-binding response OmpR family regulator